MMEGAADDEAVADCDECIVTAGWDWSIKVWRVGPGSGGQTGSGGTGW